MMAARLEQACETRGDPAADVASWLAGLFMAPLPVDSVVHYCSTDGARFLEAIGEETGCKPGIDCMRRTFVVEESPASIARRLAVTYTILFEGIAGPGTVSLYESAYAEGGGRLFQKATGDMELLLQRSGLSVSKDCCEPADHLSIELALLSAALHDDSKRGVALLRDRLRGWVPEFAARCGEADRSGFYSGAAMILNDLVTSPALRGAQCIG